MAPSQDNDGALTDLSRALKKKSSGAATKNPRKKFSARALSTDAIKHAPPATPGDYESMPAAAEPIHQGEQQAGDNKRDENANTPAELAVIDFGHMHEVLKHMNRRNGDDRGHQL